MAAIVYDGVGEGGELFGAMKFFVLQRVPSRGRWVGLIKANGGEVVQLEKLADIIIADHARKNDCPPGSVSWKWIEDSVKHGRLQDLDVHRAGPAEHVVRTVGSAQPTRRHRVPFTDGDDRFLMKWVVKAERSGLSTKGNAIYEQLEDINPRHTFQSWRDRWVKYVSRYPRPEVDDDDDEARSPMAQPPKKNGVAIKNTESTLPKTAPESRGMDSKSMPSAAKASRPVHRTRAALVESVANLPTHEAAERESSPAASPPVPLVVKSRGGYIFTAEELELLHDAYDDVMNITEDKIIDAWAAWARKFPNHTAQEWRNCFFETVMPQKKTEEEGAQTPKAPASDAYEEVLVAPPSSPPVFTPVKLGTLLEEEPRSTPTVSPQNRLGRIDPYMTDEKLFKKELADLAASLEEPLLVDFNPKISGRPTSLFQVWQVVRSEEFGGYTEVNERNLWPLVAQRMNFNHSRHSEAHLELKACYEEILADFEAWLLMQDEFDDMTESQEDALIGQQLGLTADSEVSNGGEQENDEEAEGGLEDDGGQERAEEAEDDAEEDYDDDLEAPSSMPRRISPQKRKLPDQDASGSRQGPKHRKVDKGKGKVREIPSTPDDVLNVREKPRSSYQPSPLKFSTSFEEDGDEQSDEPFGGPISKPKFGRSSATPRERFRETETQRFHFQTQRKEDHDPDSFILIPSEERRKMIADSSSAPRSRDNSGRDKSPELPSSSRRRSNHSDRISSPAAPTYNSSPLAQTDKSNRSNITAFVDRFVSLGYSQAIVIGALEATTMETGNAPVVMESLTKGDGIPENMRGVWTTVDDEVVERGETMGEEWLRVLKKQGLRRCNTRREFLKDAREARKARRK